MSGYHVGDIIEYFHGHRMFYGISLLKEAGIRKKKRKEKHLVVLS